MKIYRLYKAIFVSSLTISTCALCFFLLSPYGKLHLQKANFQNLTSWQQDNHVLAFKAFQQSCTEIVKRPNNFNWKKACSTANALSAINENTTKAFFEVNFQPYQVTHYLTKKGLFTGYYLPTLQASLKPQASYNVPIYAYPKDLIKINLGQFRKELAGKMISAQLKNNLLFPYPDRAAINAGKVNSEVIAWANNPIDLFFAQIQGSALIELPTHQKILISYAGDNGYPYTPIGKVLIQKKFIEKQNLSMQTIRQWLEKHKDQINDILNQNASYVFFKKIIGNEPSGVEQVPLTPERSLAIDTHFIPLGAPIWLETQVPAPNHQLVPFNHLLITQDTGGAIKGIIRGDIYFGEGEEAAFKAGNMKNKGQYWLLLPR